VLDYAPDFEAAGIRADVDGGKRLHDLELCSGSFSVSQERYTTNVQARREMGTVED